MSISEAIGAIIYLYYLCLKSDIDHLSHPWMYWWFLVPALLYIAFMFVKWMILSMPLWLPLSIILYNFSPSDAKKK